MNQKAGARRIREFFTSRPQFRLALGGAAAIALFSILGGLDAVAPVSRAASVDVPGPAVAPGIAALPATPALKAAAVKRPTHVVIVLEDAAPSMGLYLTALERHGATFPNAYTTTASANANFLGLFSGSTQGITGTACPQTYASGNLGTQLIKAGKTFTGYTESLPSTEITGCTTGRFDRGNTPWLDFAGVPGTRFAHFPRTGFASLPTVSVVSPNICNDMRDCDVATGDAWLQTNMSAYASWARTHNSLLIVAFGRAAPGADTVPLVFYGQPVRTGAYAQKVNQYSILRTIETWYGLPCLAHACDVRPIASVV